MKLKSRLGINKSTWKPVLSKQRLNFLYNQKRRTIEGISNLYKVSKKVISNHMKKYNIPSRGRGNRRCKIRGYKLNNQGYRMVYLPKHPRSWENSGYVAEHILIMEKKLGRNLKYFGLNNLQNEEIHHKDRNKLNNRLINLKLITRKEHSELHLSERDKYRRFLNPLLKTPPKKCLKCGQIFGKNKKHLCRARKIKNGKYQCCSCKRFLKKNCFYKDKTRKAKIDSLCIKCKKEKRKKVREKFKY